MIRTYIKELIITTTAMIVLGLVLGPNVAVFIVPIGLYYFIRLILDFAKLVKNNFTGFGLLFKRIGKGLLIFVGLFFIHKLEVYYGSENFYTDVQILNDYKDLNGDYPSSFNKIDRKMNPYISLLGPEYVYEYKPVKHKMKSPLFCLVELSPFGRRCFNFQKNKIFNID